LRSSLEETVNAFHRLARYGLPLGGDVELEEAEYDYLVIDNNGQPRVLCMWGNKAKKCLGNATDKQREEGGGGDIFWVPDPNGKGDYRDGHAYFVRGDGTVYNPDQRYPDLSAEEIKRRGSGRKK